MPSRSLRDAISMGINDAIDSGKSAYRSNFTKEGRIQKRASEMKARVAAKPQMSGDRTKREIPRGRSKMSGMDVIKSAAPRSIVNRKRQIDEASDY